MKLSRKAPGLVVLAVGLIFLSYLTIVLVRITVNTQANASEHLRWMVAALRSGLEDSSSRALAQAEMIGMAPAVRKTFAEGQRQQLLAGMGPIFALQRKKYGLDQLNFHHPDGAVFLRVQAPTEEVRIDPGRSVLGAVVRRREPRAAVEIGRTGPAIYGMVPVLWEDRLIGVCAVGMQFSQLVEQLHRDFALEAAVVFDERPLREVVSDYRAAAGQDGVAGFIQQASTDWPLCRALLAQAELGGLHEPLTYLGVVHLHDYGVAVIPLRDSSDALIGHLVGVRDFSTLGARARRTRVIAVAITLFAMILVSGVCGVVFNGMLLRPVQDLVARMQAVQRGDEALEPEPHLLSRPDEVGDLARIYQRMRP